MRGEMDIPRDLLLEDR